MDFVIRVLEETSDRVHLALFAPLTFYDDDEEYEDGYWDVAPHERQAVEAWVAIMFPRCKWQVSVWSITDYEPGESYYMRHPNDRVDHHTFRLWKEN